MQCIPHPHPLICGIINATPDSFYDGGKYNPIEHGLQLIEQGADWLDIGGESTRPNAPAISLQEEIDRVIPVIEALKDSIPISIDTTKSEVAQLAHQAGATILNDVRGFQDPKMQEISKIFEQSILMHSRGTPQTMLQQTQYKDVVTDVIEWLLQQAKLCHSPKIWLDPGIGFAKDVQQNLKLMQQLHQLVNQGYPILLGTSRKSFIGHTLSQPNPKDRLSGSLATLASGYYQGVQCFRVHDVKESKDVLRMLQAIQTA